MGPRNVENCFLRTAFHEAGHSFFYLRHGSHLESIIIDPDDPTEGEANGGTSRAMIPGLGHRAFRSSEREWLIWKRDALFQVVETLGGPLAELRFAGIELEAPIYECWLRGSKQSRLFEAFDNDLRLSEEVVATWLSNACSSVSQRPVQAQLNKIEEYVRGILDRETNWNWIRRIVDKIVAGNGFVFATEFRELRIPKRERIRADLLAFP